MKYSLFNLWQAQRDYNDKIRLESPGTPEEWTQTYLMGIVAEIDEVLREMNWKKHRKQINKVDKTNLAYELADLTKYVLSLWEVWDFSFEEMLRYTVDKSEILELLYEQEHCAPAEGAPIVICDIDGTLGDWRSSFVEWARDRSADPIPADPSKTMWMDSDLSMEYPAYNVLKEQFESEGGYLYIKPYIDLVEFLREIQEDVFLIIMTARPAKQFHRIWYDTTMWLSYYRIKPHQLFIGSEPRILLADSYRKGHKVILLEDDPGLIIRAANSGINVFARIQPYNAEINHENITFTSNFNDAEIREKIYTTLGIGERYVQQER